VPFRVGDREAHRDLLEKGRIGDGGPHGLEVRAHVERELISARLHLALGEERRVGAAVRVGGHCLDAAWPSVGPDHGEVDTEPRGRTAAGRVEDVRGQHPAATS